MNTHTIDPNYDSSLQLVRIEPLLYQRLAVKKNLVSQSAIAEEQHDRSQMASTLKNILHLNINR